MPTNSDPLADASLGPENFDGTEFERFAHRLLAQARHSLLDVQTYDEYGRPSVLTHDDREKLINMSTVGAKLWSYFDPENINPLRAIEVREMLNFGLGLTNNYVLHLDRATLPPDLLVISGLLEAARTFESGDPHEGMEGLLDRLVGHAATMAGMSKLEWVCAGDGAPDARVVAHVETSLGSGEHRLVAGALDEALRL